MNKWFCIVSQFELTCNLSECMIIHIYDFHGYISGTNFILAMPNSFGIYIYIEHYIVCLYMIVTYNELGRSTACWPLVVRRCLQCIDMNPFHALTPPSNLMFLLLWSSQLWTEKTSHFIIHSQIIIYRFFTNSPFYMWLC